MASEGASRCGNAETKRYFRLGVKVLLNRSRQPGYLDGGFFVPPAKSPIRQWIETHFLPGFPTTGRLLISGRATLDYNAFNLSPDNTPPQIQGGYPESTDRQLRKVSRQHLRIDGYPATLSRFERPKWNRTEQGIRLAVYLPDQAILYEVRITTASPGFEEIARAMPQIIASFHVDRIAVSSGSRGESRKPSF